MSYNVGPLSTVTTPGTVPHWPLVPSDVPAATPSTSGAAPHWPPVASDLTGITDTQIATANKDGTAATPSLRTLGTGALQSSAGNHGHADATDTTPGFMSAADKEKSAGLPSLAELQTVVVTRAPYYASGDARTTTTVGTTAAGTAVTLTADIGLSAGQGVFIAGAGVAAVDYIGTVVSCVGTALVVTPATSTSVSAGAKVQHDSSAAINAAMASAVASGGVRCYFPPGFYRVNGPILDPTNAKCILQVPDIVYSPAVLPGNPPVQIELCGPLPPAGVAFCSGVETYGGAVIQSDVVYASGSILGGYANTAGSYGHLTSVWLTLRNLTFRTYDDPALSGVNANYIGSCVLQDVQIDTGIQQVSGNITFPMSNGLVFGYSSPGSSSALMNELHRVAIQGYPNGIMLHEHVQLDTVYLSFCYNSLNVQTTFACGGSKVTVDKASNAITGAGVINLSGFTYDQVDFLLNGQTTGLSGSLFYKAGSGTGYINNAAGMMLYCANTGTLSVPNTQHPYATGGTITTDGAYTVHTFTSSGTFRIYGSALAEVLVVGGGGAGGGTGANACGIGGNGGQVVHSTAVPVAGVCAVVVGDGGTGATNASGGDGGGSSVAGVTATGGTGGGGWNGASPGRAGGTGAGGAGIDGDSTHGGIGGVGLAYATSGSSTYYGAGGGTGYTTGGIGGIGGGGYGDNYGAGGGTAGTANTGGGGGGNSSAGSTAGHNGGSGIVIIKYLT